MVGAGVPPAGIVGAGVPPARSRTRARARARVLKREVADTCGARCLSGVGGTHAHPRPLRVPCPRLRTRLDQRPPGGDLGRRVRRAREESEEAPAAAVMVHDRDDERQHLQLQYGMQFLPEVPGHELSARLVGEHDAYLMGELRYTPGSDVVGVGRLSAGLDVFGRSDFDLTLGLFIGTAGEWDPPESTAPCSTPRRSAAPRSASATRASGSGRSTAGSPAGAAARSTTCSPRTSSPSATACCRGSTRSGSTWSSFAGRAREQGRRRRRRARHALTGERRGTTGDAPPPRRRRARRARPTSDPEPGLAEPLRTRCRCRATPWST